MMREPCGCFIDGLEEQQIRAGLDEPSIHYCSVHGAAPPFREALQAIRARINGEFDHLALVKFGPLTSDTTEDIRHIIEETARRTGVHLL